MSISIAFAARKSNLAPKGKFKVQNPKAKQYPKAKGQIRSTDRKSVRLFFLAYLRACALRVTRPLGH